MILTDFDYVRAATLDEAAALLAEPGSRALAGGQSLLVELKTGEGTAARLVDLRGLAGLRGVQETGAGGLRVGALTTLAELARDPRVRAVSPALAEAARAVGDPQVRHLGTLGGNLAAATDITPAGAVSGARDKATDLPAAVLAADATLRLAGAGGRTTMTAGDFARDGLPTGCLITGIDLPAPGPGEAGAFEKMPDRASRYPVCAVAVRVVREPGGGLTGLRVAVTGATPRATRLPAVEELLTGTAAGTAQGAGAGAGPGAALGTAPGTAQVLAAFRAQPEHLFVTGRGTSAEYLRHLSGVLTARALTRATATTT
ncbi:FAD binding domain-containing protein [Streptomyces sp. NPDC086080]|uniref:FAD binding domain-containing protein n=1 Tax=Streptomyces sp. NPDC086080 TaxID=3365748 RepID=UPI0037D86AFA